MQVRVCMEVGGAHRRHKNIRERKRNDKIICCFMVFVFFFHIFISIENIQIEVGTLRAKNARGNTAL